MALTHDLTSYKLSVADPHLLADEVLMQQSPGGDVTQWFSYTFPLATLSSTHVITVALLEGVDTNPSELVLHSTVSGSVLYFSLTTTRAGNGEINGGNLYQVTLDVRESAAAGVPVPRLVRKLRVRIAGVPHQATGGIWRP